MRVLWFLSTYHFSRLESVTLRRSDIELKKWSFFVHFRISYMDNELIKNSFGLIRIFPEVTGNFNFLFLRGQLSTLYLYWTKDFSAISHPFCMIFFLFLCEISWPIRIKQFWGIKIKICMGKILFFDNKRLCKKI
jgi:hypothetical protein